MPFNSPFHVNKYRQTNCLTEVVFDDALQDAVRLDAYYQKNGKLVGPLHGVPMTLKDQFNVKGSDSTIGYVSRAFAPADTDAVIVEILKGLGAVILAKTNLPQSIMVRRQKRSKRSCLCVSSGVKQRIQCGDSRRILSIPNSLLVVLRAVKEPCSRSTGPWSDGGPILVDRYVFQVT